jgi:fatty-acyl-CoA synthase
VCVIAVADSRWGEVGRAVVVPAAGQQLDGAALLQLLEGRLARYKIPCSVVFAEALPRNPGGKVLRPALRERYGDRK